MKSRWLDYYFICEYDRDVFVLTISEFVVEIWLGGSALLSFQTREAIVACYST